MQQLYDIYVFKVSNYAFISFSFTILKWFNDNNVHIIERFKINRCIYIRIIPHSIYSNEFFQCRRLLSCHEVLDDSYGALRSIELLLFRRTGSGGSKFHFLSTAFFWNLSTTSLKQLSFFATLNLSQCSVFIAISDFVIGGTHTRPLVVKSIFSCWDIAFLILTLQRYLSWYSSRRLLFCFMISSIPENL